MADLTTLARPAVAPLLTKSTDDLYLEIGARQAEIRRNPAVAAGFAPAGPIEIESLGMRDDLRDFGKRFFNKMNRQAYELVCGADADNSKERQDLLAALGLKDKAMATAALAALLVAQLGLAALIAAPVAAIAMSLAFQPAYQSMCEVWKTKLPAG
jgi:hypothetical protein